VLTSKGVSAWRSLLAGITSPPPAPEVARRGCSTLPTRLASDLVNALAALALAGT